MYSVYHEMDITQFIETMNQFYADEAANTKLKRIRKNRGLSQSELASESGVHIRSIQMYEQKAKRYKQSTGENTLQALAGIWLQCRRLIRNPHGLKE